MPLASATSLRLVFAHWIGVPLLAQCSGLVLRLGNYCTVKEESKLDWKAKCQPCLLHPLSLPGAQAQSETWVQKEQEALWGQQVSAPPSTPPEDSLGITEVPSAFQPLCSICLLMMVIMRIIS